MSNTNSENKINRDNYSIEVYQDQSDQIPFWDWIKGLNNKKTEERLLERFDRVELGNFGDCKSLGGGLMELRFRFGPGYRIYCSIRSGRVVLLLVGSDKSNQRRAISKARSYLADYIQRSEPEGKGNESVNPVRKNPR